MVSNAELVEYYKRIIQEDGQSVLISRLNRCSKKYLIDIAAYLELPTETLTTKVKISKAIVSNLVNNLNLPKE